MKKNIVLSIAIGLSVALYSCKSDNTENEKDNASESTNSEQWAELAESQTMLVKPEGWDEDYWKSGHKNIDNQKLFSSVLEAVLAGRVKAYNIFTDSLLTIEEVKEKVALDTTNNESGQEGVKADDLSLIRMREKWVFDKEKFHLEKQVKRLDLIYKRLNESGEYIGDKPLFYVYLN